MQIGLDSNIVIHLLKKQKEKKAHGFNKELKLTQTLFLHSKIKYKPFYKEKAQIS